MSTRTEKALIEDSGAWVFQRREELGWSPAKLAIRVRMMRICQSGLRRRSPTAADILTLEAGELRQLPRWLTLVEDVFAFVNVAPEHRVSWIDRRNWRYAGHPADLAEILVHRDEYMFLENLGLLKEDDRRAWRAVLTRWTTYGDKEHHRLQAARDWLRRLGIATDVLSEAEREMMEHLRSLSRAKQAKFSTLLRDAGPWPMSVTIDFDDPAYKVLEGFRDADGDDQAVLYLLASNGNMRRVILNAIHSLGADNLLSEAEKFERAKRAEAAEAQLDDDL